LEAIDLLGDALAVNTVITDRRELSFVNFGEIKQSHLLAVEYTRPFAEVFLPQKYQTIITSSAGYPLDKTYYQTIKGMVGALEVLKRGGDIFMVSQMSEGFGSAEYRQAQKRLIELGEEGFLKELEARKKAAIDEWETEMQLKVTRKGTVRLFTRGLTPDEERLTGVEVFSDLTEFSRAIARSGFSEKQALVIPEGPYILPFLKV
ncbi:MAG: hypothetical protein V3V76_08185, partial [Candidatus Adiutricales bacterium]